MLIEDVYSDVHYSKKPMLRKNASSPRLIRQAKDPLLANPFQDQTNTLAQPERRLKKVATTKIMRRETHLPTIQPAASHKQVLSNPHLRTEPLQPLQRVQQEAEQQTTKHLSFRRKKQMPMVNREPRMAYSQKEEHEKGESQRSKEMALRRKFLVRQKKMLPMRNCVSAEPIKNDSKIAPEKVRGARKTMLVRRQHQLVSQVSQVAPFPEQEPGVSLLDKAKMLARECLEQGKSVKQGASMEQMLQQWHPF